MTALNQDLLFRTPNVYSWGGGFDLSPDGRSLLITLEERDSSDLMLVENFR